MQARVLFFSVFFSLVAAAFSVRWDFLAYCTRPVRVHLAMACVSCSFDSFLVFLLSLKQQQNLMKIMFSCICFPVWPHPPKIMIYFYFILVNCMGWQICVNIWITLTVYNIVIQPQTEMATLSNATDIIYIMVSQTTYKWLLKLWIWILSTYYGLSNNL